MKISEGTGGLGRSLAKEGRRVMGRLSLTPPGKKRRWPRAEMDGTACSALSSQAPSTPPLPPASSKVGFALHQGTSLGQGLSLLYLQVRSALLSRISASCPAPSPGEHVEGMGQS